NQVVTHQPGAAEQKTFIPAFTDTISPPPRRRIGKTAGLCGRRIKTACLKPIDRRPPLNHNDSGGAEQETTWAARSRGRCCANHTDPDGADPATPSHKSDIAFQHAMRCAVARGLERPPRLGVVKDRRPLTAPRLFEPVPRSSGCTSPAFECAELV